MYREYMELIKLDTAVGNLSRTLKHRIRESAKEIHSMTRSEKTVVNIDNKAYLVHKIDYRTIELVEVNVVEG